MDCASSTTSDSTTDSTFLGEMPDDICSMVGERVHGTALAEMMADLRVKLERLGGNDRTFDEFRRRMHATDAVISGSWVLQHLLSSATWKANDVDVFVPAAAEFARARKDFPSGPNEFSWPANRMFTRSPWFRFVMWLRGHGAYAQDDDGLHVAYAQPQRPGAGNACEYMTIFPNSMVLHVATLQIGQEKLQIIFVNATPATLAHFFADTFDFGQLRNWIGFDERLQPQLHVSHPSQLHSRTLIVDVVTLLCTNPLRLKKWAARGYTLVATQALIHFARVFEAHVDPLTPDAGALFLDELAVSQRQPPGKMARRSPPLPIPSAKDRMQIIVQTLREMGVLPSDDESTTTATLSSSFSTASLTASSSTEDRRLSKCMTNDAAGL